MPEVRIEEVRRFMEDSLRAVGTPEMEAKDHAALLLHADLTGHFSHGLNRLGFLKHCATVGNFCMDLAMKKAKESGVGWVSVKRSNHFGMAGWWAQKAKSEGLIGMAFTNSSPILVPTRAKDGVCGTNPIAMCAPANDGDSLLVDMASTAVAMGKIEMQIHKKEPIPEGWALGPDGKSTTDAQLAFGTGKLQPLGGFEDTSGYKGYALSTMVEVFCSGLSGSKPSHQIRGWSLGTNGDPPNLGQCFVAIDPDCFAPGFGERIADCLRQYRSLEPVNPSLPVLAPGDKERINLENATKKASITYVKGQIDVCNKLASELNIKAIEVL